MPPAASRSLARRLLPYVLAVVAVLLLLELVLRLTLGSGRVLSVELDLPDGRCVGLTPNAVVEYDGGPFDRKIPVVRHDANAHGFRGPARPHRKGPGVFRILMLGDSHTYGFGIEAADAIPAQLERLLNAGRATTIEVLNFGIPGMNLEETLAQYLLFARRWEHDLVLVDLVANDLDAGICAYVQANRTWFWIMSKVYLSRLVGWIFFTQYPREEVPGEEDRTSPSRLKRGIAALHESVLDAGGELGVVCLGNPLASEAQLAGVFADLQLPWLSLTRFEAETRPYDGHYSARGAGQIAARIADWLLHDARLVSTDETSAPARQVREEPTDRPPTPDESPNGSAGR